MKRNRLKIGLLTACLASVGSVAAAQNCGVESHSKPCKCQQTRKLCDDIGLLRIINDAASSIEDRLARMLPDTASECDEPSCGCAQCQSIASWGQTHPTQRSALPLIQEAEQPLPIPRPSPMNNPAPEPGGPSVRTPELVPAPVKETDPFQDDTARSTRPISARPVSHQRSNAPRAQSFDPQASSRTSRKINRTVQGVTSSHDYAMQLWTGKSPVNASARTNLQPALAPTLASEAVVTAAAARVLTKPPVAQRPNEPAVEPAYFNPLRDR